jgi:hypothetical protein
VPVEKSFAERLRRLLRQPPAPRKLTLVYDRRDQPPWTAELEIDGRRVALRAGATLQQAITAVVAAERAHAERPPTLAPRAPGR